ncbi:MAG: hypothetical protein F6J87_11235 [Spirulina sp. SIO3F2]|nr:hypothetical protein [Spirulina sp. SIO3F2]
MITTVFQDFLTTHITPSPDVCDRALQSRQFYLARLEALAAQNPDFPALAPQHLDTSPLFRKTQIRPLQQLSLLLLLQAPKLETNPSPIFPQVYWLKLTELESPLSRYRDEHDYFSSTLLLQGLGNYCKGLRPIKSWLEADALCWQRRGDAWLLQLIPTILVQDQRGQALYDLVPDGSGNWRRSPERKRLAQLQAVNVRYQGQVLPLVRLLQYWRQQVGLAIAASDWEALIVQVLSQHKGSFTGFPAGLLCFWQGCQGLSLGSEDKMILNHAAQAAALAEQAIADADEGKVDAALELWQQIFGAVFGGDESD